jgi:hypothetical protein
MEYFLALSLVLLFALCVGFLVAGNCRAACYRRRLLAVLAFADRPLTMDTLRHLLGGSPYRLNWFLEDMVRAGFIHRSHQLTDTATGPQERCVFTLTNEGNHEVSRQVARL